MRCSAAACPTRGHVQVPIAVWAISNPALREHLENRFFGTTIITHYMLCAAGGFFLHDAVSCLIRESPFYIVHGLTCCAGYTLGAAYGCGHFYGGLFLMWEVSTPFVQLRWVLYKMGRSETLLYRINGTLMVLSFGIARILLGTCAHPAVCFAKCVCLLCGRSCDAAGCSMPLQGLLDSGCTLASMRRRFTA